MIIFEYENVLVDKTGKNVKPCLQLLNNFLLLDNQVEIWSDDIESNRQNIQTWIGEHIFENSQYPVILRMRPIGLDCLKSRLFEHWLYETRIEYNKPMNAGEWLRLQNSNFEHVEMAFLSDKPTIDLFLSHKIHVLSYKF